MTFEVIARKAALMALREGLIPTAPCASCKRSYDPKLFHMHHEDYQRPFDIIWLCRRCHAVEHAQRPTADVWFWSEYFGQFVRRPRYVKTSKGKKPLQVTDTVQVE